MRTTPRRLLAVVALGAVVAPLAACGDDEPSASPSTDAAGGSSSLTVHALDSLKFDQPAYTVEAGTIDVEYVNDGSLPHTLLIKETDDLFLEVGGTDEGTVELEPGTYTLYCDIAGHEEAGMVAELTVE